MDTQKVFQIFQLHIIDGRRYLMQSLTHSVERLATMHFCKISIVAGRVNKKAGSFIYDVYLATAWMLQQGIRAGNRTT